jgi:hypothetical protein
MMDEGMSESDNGIMEGKYVARNCPAEYHRSTPTQPYGLLAISLWPLANLRPCANS